MIALRSRGGVLAAVIALALCSGCQVLMPRAEPLAQSALAADFSSYRIARVGILPFTGRDLDDQSASRLQRSFQLELGRVMPYELIPLGPSDLEEVRRSDPYRRGRYHPRTILEIAKRFRLDALLVGTVSQLEPYPPQSLALGLEMVASETGLTIWSSSVHLDAADAGVRARLERWQSRQRTEGGKKESVQLTLASPERFTRFAAWEVARSTLKGADASPQQGSPRNAFAPHK